MPKFQEKDLNNLSKLEVKKIIISLSEDIIKYNKAYYEEDVPIISDAEYDYLFGLLASLEKKFPQFKTQNSPTQSIGASPSGKFEKITHKVPMLSLGNGFSLEDINDFITRVKNFLNIDYFPHFFCEPKIDGLSFSLLYENGELKAGATRGDGYVGEDVTNNLKTIKTIPLKINNAPELLEIRGEIYIDLVDFEKLNKSQREQNLTEFANPRNAAAGSLKQLNPDVTANRPLKYFVYAVGFASDKIAFSQEELLIKLAEFGFVINITNKLAKDVNEIFEFYEQLKNIRNILTYELDGVIYKLNDFALQERMGFAGRNPRFAIAHKFPAIIGITKLLDITMQVGRTGAVTPVANLEPIFISGAKIARASLHNFDEIERKDVRIGDYVYLQRAGDVIPQITGVDVSRRGSEAEKFIPPAHCPSCNSFLHYSKVEVAVRCDNGLACPAQNYGRLYHFVSKVALDIEGLGKKQIKFLIEQGFIKTPVDIFRLSTQHNLKELDRWGEKSVSNLLVNIQKAKNTTLNRFIYSLGITHIGQNNAKILAREFTSASNFLNLMINIVSQDNSIYQRLDNLDGIGPKVLRALVDFFSIKHNIEIVRELITILNIEDYKDNNITSVIGGKIIVFTGSMTNLSRAEAKNKAENLGLKVTTTISANTDILVAGENAGSKLKKAHELGIKVMNEEEWVEYIKNQ